MLLFWHNNLSLLRFRRRKASYNWSRNYFNVLRFFIFHHHTLTCTPLKILVTASQPSFHYLHLSCIQSCHFHVFFYSLNNLHSEASNPQPSNPNTNTNNQPGPVSPNNNNGGGGGFGGIVQLTGLFWSMQPIIIRNDARSLIRLRVTAPISNTSDSVSGRGLWRVALFGASDSIGGEPRFDYHHQILRQEDQNEAAAPYTNLSFNANTDFDLMGIGCMQYLYLCIEFAKGDNPVPAFYLPLNGGESSIVSCQRAKCFSKLLFKIANDYHTLVGGA